MKKYTVYIAALCMAVLCGCERRENGLNLPVFEVSSAIDITSSSATLCGALRQEVSQGGIASVTFEWSEFESFDVFYASDPQWIALEGDLGRTITTSATGLSPNTIYYFRARLEKDPRYSNALYSNVSSFITDDLSAGITVVTEETQSVTSCTARSYGSCTAYRCTLAESGMVLDVMNYQELTRTNYLYRRKGLYTDFFASWYDLQPNTTYRVRAYAVDTDGNTYYGGIRTFTTLSEPGGPLTSSDFIGTFTVSVYSPWESKYITWSDVQIKQYGGDTVVAIGWLESDLCRSLGVFDQGRQVIRFESGWFFPYQTFTYNSKTCVFQFMPVYYNSSDGYAYDITDGGRFGHGEIWLRKTGTNGYEMVAQDGDDQYGQYANGFLFHYKEISTDKQIGEKLANTAVYTRVQLTRTSTSTTKMPAQMPANPLLQIDRHATMQVIKEPDAGNAEKSRISTSTSVLDRLQ